MYLKKLLDKFEPGTIAITEYKSAKTKITLQCAHGHNREVIPSNLSTRGNGATCRECVGKSAMQKKTHEEFIKEVGILYPQIKVITEYTGAKNTVTIQHIACGNKWDVLPTNLLSRSSDANCSVCNEFKPKALSVLEVNNKIQEHYPYLEVTNYIPNGGVSSILDHRCGGTTLSITNNLVRGWAWTCDVCEPHSQGISAMEMALVSFIQDNYAGEVVTQDKTLISPKHIDIVLPQLRLGIEFDGTYFHSEARNSDKNYHVNKTKSMQLAGYQLLHIYDQEWVNKRKIVESRLLNILGKSNKIYARKCVLTPISFPRQFLEDNHIQGAGANTSVNYGLFSNNELVSVMTFAKSKFTDIAEYELVRFCNKLNTSVVGGASRMLQRFRVDIGVSLYSYSDRRWSNGKLYTTLGFKHHSTSSPGYMYVKGMQQLSRMRCQKKYLVERYSKEPWFSEDLTEHEIMAKLGYYRIFDCGNDVWLLK